MADTIKKYNATKFIQKFVVDDLSAIVTNHPFHAFFLLSAAIELFGKCMDSSPDWHQGKSRTNFKKAIKKLSSLKKYRPYSNDMYSCLRCGLLHAFMPEEGIKLKDGRNDLSNNVIGCQELYEDIKKAWYELEQSSLCQKDMSKDLFEVDESISLSAMTPTIKTIITK